MSKCDRYKSEHLKKKTYRKKLLLDQKNHFNSKPHDISARIAQKTTTREWTPGFKRLNEYKTYSTERGDLDEEEEFKSNKALSVKVLKYH
ncbi:MAG: hypothetical protein ACRD5E_01350 [Nitrososphaeraceae archaeon]